MIFKPGDLVKIIDETLFAKQGAVCIVMGYDDRRSAIYGKDVARVLYGDAIYFCFEQKLEALVSYVICEDVCIN